MQTSPNNDFRDEEIDEQQIQFSFWDDELVKNVLEGRGKLFQKPLRRQFGREKSKFKTVGDATNEFLLAMLVTHTCFAQFTNNKSKL